MMNKVRLCLMCIMLFAMPIVMHSSNADAAELPKVDPEAHGVIKACGEFYRSLNTFQVRIESKQVFELLGETTDRNSTIVINAQRPNECAISIKSVDDGLSTELILKCDGTSIFGGRSLTENSQTKTRYATAKAPLSWDSIICNPFASVGLASATLSRVPAMLFHSDPAAFLLDEAANVHLEGRELIDGIMCNIVRSSSVASTRNAGADFDWRVWIETGERPLVRKVEVSSGAITTKFVKVKVVSFFKEWVVDRPIPHTAFDYSIPLEGIEVASFERILSEKARANKSKASTADLLIGKKAPMAKLELLDEGMVDLQSLKSEQIVILYFWSTTCISCVRALPILDNLASEYGSKRVQLYAVNVGQSHGDVREFLEKVEWQGKIRISLDHSEAMAKAFGVITLPTIVVIDKNGTVNAMRNGIGKEFQSQLRSDIDLLLAGKKLPIEKPVPKSSAIEHIEK